MRSDYSLKTIYYNTAPHCIEDSIEDSRAMEGGQGTGYYGGARQFGTIEKYPSWSS